MVRIARVAGTGLSVERLFGVGGGGAGVHRSVRAPAREAP